MAEDVNIVLAAKDQATDILDKFESSIEGLAQKLTDLGKASEEADSKLNLSIGGLSQISAESAAASTKLANTAAMATKLFIAFQVVVGAAKAVGAAIAGMSSAVEAFGRQEEAARGMTQAQLDYASALQIATNAGDEMTLGLMRQAEAMGANKEQSADVATAALAMAKQFGISQEEALKKTMQALSGNANAWVELIPEIRNAATEEEKLALIQERVNSGLQRMQDEAGTTQGIMARAAGAFGDLQEKIGAILSPLFAVVYEGFAVFAETLQTMLMPAIDATNGAFAALEPIIQAIIRAFQNTAVVVGVAVQSMISVIAAFGSNIGDMLGGAGEAAMGFEGTFKAVAKGVIYAITAIETFFLNFGTAWELIATKIALAVVTFAEDVKYYFTQVIPAYFAWFVENAGAIFTDLANLIVTIFKNLGTKISGAITALWEFISSGFEGGLGAFGDKLSSILSGSLTEGFEATTQALPEIAARGMSATEQALSERANQLGTDIGNEFNRKYEERIAALDASLTSDVVIDAPKLESMVSGAIEDGVKDAEDRKAKSDKEAAKGAFSTVGELAANASRLLTRGQEVRSPMQAVFEEIARNTAAAISVLNEVKGELSTLRASLPKTTVNITPTP